MKTIYIILTTIGLTAFAVFFLSTMFLKWNIQQENEWYYGKGYEYGFSIMKQNCIDSMVGLKGDINSMTYPYPYANLSPENSTFVSAGELSINPLLNQNTTGALIIGSPNGTETLRINNDGSIYHNGKFVGNDSEIPELFKKALKGVLTN